ncbi:MAG: hypothetical protein NT074_07675 [Methanomicrobiales archaeon]|nr:hypothetical protein [Methanomicrobiales archaeon]
MMQGADIRAGRVQEVEGRLIIPLVREARLSCGGLMVFHRPVALVVIEGGRADCVVLEEGFSPDEALALIRGSTGTST